ncbi:MAG: hypothetical protein U1D55_17110 [Phycisphaerae bacterium]
MTELPADSKAPLVKTPAHEPLADRERHNPYFRWLIHLGLPAAASLVVHLVLFGVLALQTWNILARQPRTMEDVEAGISTAGDDLGSLTWPGEQTLDIGDPSVPAPEAADLATLRDLAKLDVPEPGVTPDISSGGFGVGTEGRSGVLGIGSGAGEGGGAGLGAGLGADRTFGAGVWDLRVSGNSFAYVVDFSGSIVNAVDDLKRELKRSIGSLKPKQTFNVTVFYGRVGAQQLVTESFADSLQSASAENKANLFRWLDAKKPSGSTEPLAAMKRSLALRPEVVFFFSDGLFDEMIVDEITRGNRSSGCRIHCLVFDELMLSDTSGLPRLTDGAKRLQRIAEQNGGRVKVVTGLDLRKR